jgi:uncharacterized protein (TIGR00255 family)
MAIASMTGFARSRGVVANASWAWEVKSVNGRGLDVRLRVPPGFDEVEPQAREALSRALGRGNVQAGLTVERPARPVEVRVDEAALEALVRAADAVRARTGVAPATLDGLLSVRGVVDLVEQPESDEERQALQAAVLQGLTAAIEGLIGARHDEGARLAALLDGHLTTIEELVARAEHLPARQPDAIKARLAELVRQLVDGEVRLDPDRLHQEAVIAATKADIREELDRLTAHVAHARRLIADGGAVGRKLDFLAQEFNREANTLCSKSNDRALTEIGLSLKTVIDQMREQVQNVE